MPQKLRDLHKQYEKNSLEETVRSAEVNRTNFWKLLKKIKTNQKVMVFAVKDKTEKTVYSIDEILEVWRCHFSTLCQPRESQSFHREHYTKVMHKVETWAGLKDQDEFLTSEFSKDEITKALKALNLHKAPGIDGVTKKHLVNAGKAVVDILYILYKWIMQISYVPVIFRRGVQIPLYKGKNTSTLNTDNFRGITLLSVFNKILEILIWKRIEGWWNDNQILSVNQCACRKGVSSLHTAMLLQESISYNLEHHEKIFCNISRC